MAKILSLTIFPMWLILVRNTENHKALVHRHQTVVAVRERFMKFVLPFLSLVLIAFASPASAGYELICKGSQPTSANKPISVDCNDRKQVVDTLGAAWREVRANSIGGSTEDMCWKPYQRAKELHPSISMNGIAQTFFTQCNMALQYVKTN